MCIRDSRDRPLDDTNYWPDYIITSESEWYYLNPNNRRKVTTTANEEAVAVALPDADWRIKMIRRLLVTHSDFFDNTTRRGHNSKNLYRRSQVTRTESIIPVFFAPPHSTTKRDSILLTTWNWNAENRARVLDDFSLISPQMRLQRACRGAVRGGRKGTWTSPFRLISSASDVAYRHDVTCVLASVKKARNCYVCMPSVNWKRLRRRSCVFTLFSLIEVDRPWRYCCTTTTQCNVRTDELAYCRRCRYPSFKFTTSLKELCAV